ncbi:MAG: hypothetical protein ABI175_10335, partial [Polyangiales bacterium]
MSWWRGLFLSPTHGEDVERRLRHVQPKPIAGSVGGGVITVAGTVDSIDPLVAAPLTGRRCVYWTLTVSEIMKSLVAVELANLQGGAPFLIVDGPARARVIPDRARISAPIETRLRAVQSVASTGTWGTLASEPPILSPEEWQLFEPLGVAIAKTSRLRFTEYVIESGAPLLVRGSGETEADT